MATRKKSSRFQTIGETVRMSEKPETSLGQRARKGTFQVSDDVAKLSFAPQSPVDERVRSRGRFQVSEDAAKIVTQPAPVRDDIPIAEQLQSPRGGRR